MRPETVKTDRNECSAFFENLMLLVLLVFILAVLTPGCVTTPTTVITTGSDNATAMASATSSLTAEGLLQYIHLAENEALSASQLFEATSDGTALQKASWWLQYASGIAGKLDALMESSD